MRNLRHRCIRAGQSDMRRCLHNTYFRYRSYKCRYSIAARRRSFRSVLLQPCCRFFLHRKGIPRRGSCGLLPERNIRCQVCSNIPEMPFRSRSANHKGSVRCCRSLDSSSRCFPESIFSAYVRCCSWIRPDNSWRRRRIRIGRYSTAARRTYCRSDRRKPVFCR